MIDLRRLDRILDALPPADAAFLSPLVEPPWRQRERRLAARDAAIRAALELLAGDPNPVARLVEQMRRPRSATGACPVAGAVAAILELNDGAALGARQVRNVAAGTRT